MAIEIDPQKPLVVFLDFESPHAVVYRLLFKTPDGEWTPFATGSHEATLSMQGHTLDPLPKGSQLFYVFIFSGNPQTTFRTVVRLQQDGQDVGRTTISGTIGDQSVAVRRKTEDLS